MSTVYTYEFERFINPLVFIQYYVVIYTNLARHQWNINPRLQLLQALVFTQSKNHLLYNRNCLKFIVLRSNNQRSRIPDKWICTSYILIPVINSGGFKWGIYKNMIIFLIGIDYMNKSHRVCFIINWYQFSIWFFHNMK